MSPFYPANTDGALDPRPCNGRNIRWFLKPGLHTAVTIAEHACDHI